MILRKIIAYTILPLIMLFIGVIGIVYPEKVNKSKWISKPFEFKTLNKNENTIRTATIVNCICLLMEGIIYSIIKNILRTVPKSITNLNIIYFSLNYHSYQTL